MVKKEKKTERAPRANEKKRRIKIVGIGSYTPEKVLTNADLEKMVDTSDEWITTRTGIKERRIAAEDQATSDLGIEAARVALEDAGLTPDDIDLILVATNTTDTPFPSTACWIQKGLGADHVPAFDISAGCTAFIYGMIIAESLILNGTNKRILLLGPEMLSRCTNWEDRNTCVLFGDGAGAVVLEESSDDSGMLSSYWKADGNLGDLLSLPGGGSRMPVTHEMVDQNLHYLQMKGNEVFKHAVKRMGEAAVESLKRAGLEKEDVDYLIPHQANIRIIDATGRRLKLPPEKVFVNIHKYGNMSVATIPVGLDELAKEGKLKKGDIIVLDAFGAGFTWAALVYRW
jgi:3-oxoacyl-[acyl-carrier-protein] synthase-3